VGDDDGGELMTPEEFEEYKKKVLPMVNISALTYFINEVSVRNACFNTSGVINTPPSSSSTILQIKCFF
jgi:hypothetical protein